MDYGQWFQLGLTILNGIIGLFIAKQIQTVHVLMNSRLSELLELKGDERFAAGKEQQRKEEEKEK